MPLQHDIRFCTTSDGVRIAYATYGSGYPFIWCPGWITHLERDGFMTAPLIEHWVDKCMVVRYDKRGTGLSDRNQQDLSIEARVSDLEAVVDALKLKKFALMGVSEGGPIAITYAAKYPRRVSHLVVYGSYAKGGFTKPDASAALRGLVRAQWGIASSVFTDILMPEATPEQRRSFAKLQLAGASVDDAIHLLEAVDHTDVSHLLPKITARTLVVHGKRDKAIPFSAGRDLAAGIKNARLFAYDGGHRPAPAGDEQIMAAVESFLADVIALREAGDSTAPGLRTVLFTDLVSHTEMMSRLGDDRGRQLLRAHEEITRETLKQHGGAEVKTMGDGFIASFGSVTRAMECAIALQRAFAAHNESSPEPLHVRAGLNAGEPIEEDGDLFGASVIMASRVCAQAGPGEILIPEPVRHLLSGKGFLFNDRGEFLPKGFEDRVRLFEVRWQA